MYNLRERTVFFQNLMFYYRFLIFGSFLVRPKAGVKATIKTSFRREVREVVTTPTPQSFLSLAITA
jgi:hypothetical protein